MSQIKIKQNTFFFFKWNKTDQDVQCVGLQCASSIWKLSGMQRKFVHLFNCIFKTEIYV